MKKLLIGGLLTLFTLSAFAIQAPFQPWADKLISHKIMKLDSGSVLVGNSKNKAVAAPMTGIIAIDNTGLTTVNATAADGLDLPRRYVEIYDFDVDGGSTGEITLDTEFPDNSVIKHCVIDVLTTFTSSTDISSIAISIPTDGDLQAGKAIDESGDIWDAGLHETATKGNDYSDPSTYLKTTAARAMTITISSEDLTAGKMLISCDFFISL